MDGDTHGLGFRSVSASSYRCPSSSSVFLSPFSSITSPSLRRLSSSRSNNHLHPVPSSRNLAYVSLDGRLMNAEEASSARAIKGELSREETVAWELFTPIQRFLIVAVIGAAAAESKKNRLISQLKKSVEFRDEVLSSMQLKLDNLCEQLNQVQDQPKMEANVSPNFRDEVLSSLQLKLDNLCEQLNQVQDQPKMKASISSNGKGASPDCEPFGFNDRINFVDCGCWHCDEHHDLFVGLMGNSIVKTSCGEEMLKYKMTNANDLEQEERRMSDMSDWATSSATSCAEIQMNSFATEQDIVNLRKECEEKDATIIQLTTLLQASSETGSKRISELEDIIRRKNLLVTKQKKDMAVLEQKVVQLTRLRRLSSTNSASSDSTDSDSAPDFRQFPAMSDNLLYDMDYSSSGSSSDSESKPRNRLEEVQETPLQNDSDSLLMNELKAKLQDTPLQNNSDGPPMNQLEARVHDTSLQNDSDSPAMNQLEFKVEDTPLQNDSDIPLMNRLEDEVQDTPLQNDSDSPAMNRLEDEVEESPLQNDSDSPAINRLEDEVQESPLHNDSESHLMDQLEAKVQDTPIRNHKSALTSNKKSAPPRVSLVKPTDRHTKLSRPFSPSSSSSSGWSPRTQKESKARDNTPSHNVNSVSTSKSRTAPPKVSTSLVKRTKKPSPPSSNIKSRSVSSSTPKEVSQTPKTNRLSTLKQKQLSVRGDVKKGTTTRRVQTSSSSDATPQKN